jgi:hypothetical protein
LVGFVPVPATGGPLADRHGTSGSLLQGRNSPAQIVELGHYAFVKPGLYGKPWSE